MAISDASYLFWGLVTRIVSTVQGSQIAYLSCTQHFLASQILVMLISCVTEFGKGSQDIMPVVFLL